MFNFKLKIDWVLGKFGYVPKVEINDQPLIPPTLKKKPALKKATTRKVAAKKNTAKKPKQA